MAPILLATSGMADKPRILVVDNEFGPRESIRLALNREYEVATVESGDLALKAIDTFGPDLVITDIKMPGIDGVEVLRRIKARDATIEVILITAFASVETAKNALTYGASEYLVKPFPIRDLQDAVGRGLLTRRQMLGPQGQVARLVREMRILASKTLELEEATRANPLEHSLRVAQLSVLREISQGILAQLDLPGLIPAITDAIKAGFGYDEVSITPGAEHPDDAQDPAYVVCPLRDGQTPLGSLVVDNRRSGRPVDPRERELLEMLSAYVIIAFRNARFCEEARQREAQLRQAQKMEAIGRLAGGVAHDFNNVLTIISGRARMVLRHLGLDESVSRNVGLIEKAAERAAALTRQLLAFSRKQMLQPTVVDLNEIVSSMVVMLRRPIGAHIELVTVLDPALGHVKADRSQMEQVIMNLVVNARDAMPKGGKMLITTANGEPTGKSHPSDGLHPYVTLAVSDTGIGMDTETRAHLFEPFFTTKEPGKGTGLGLSTVYGIVQQHGGHIAVESAPHVGSRFTIHLPRCDEAPVEVPSGAGAPPVSRGFETVLLVEDEEGVRSLAGEILQESGYTVLEAQDGDKALDVCRHYECPIDLLVTDVVMPKMGGWQLAERVRSMRPDIGLLYISGYTDEAIRQGRVLAADAVFLHKPFTPEALIGKVREVLDSRGQGQRGWRDGGREEPGRAEPVAS